MCIEFIVGTLIGFTKSAGFTHILSCEFVDDRKRIVSAPIRAPKDFGQHFRREPPYVGVRRGIDLTQNREPFTFVERGELWSFDVD